MGLIDSLKRAVFGTRSLSSGEGVEHHSPGRTSGSEFQAATAEFERTLTADQWLDRRLADKNVGLSEDVIEQYRSYLATLSATDVERIVVRIKATLQGPLDDYQFGSCVKLVEALGPRAASLALALIEHMIDGSNSWRRGRAVEALGAIGPGAAVAVPQLKALAQRSAETKLMRARAQNAIRRVCGATDETQGQVVVRRFVEHLTSQGLAPTVDPYEDGHTWDVKANINSATYRIQIMDPAQGSLTMAWRSTPDNEIALGTEENVNPTDTDKHVLQLCRQVDQGKFRA